MESVGKDSESLGDELFSFALPAKRGPSQLQGPTDKSSENSEYEEEEIEDERGEEVIFLLFVLE